MGIIHEYMLKLGGSHVITSFYNSLGLKMNYMFFVPSTVFIQHSAYARACMVPDFESYA
jgi:hypothetical protein